MSDARTTKPTVPAASLPIDGAGWDTFSYTTLLLAIVAVPCSLAAVLGRGMLTAIPISLLTTIPVFVVYWMTISAKGLNTAATAQCPGRPIEHYVFFKKEQDRKLYQGHQKIPFWTFFEMYIEGLVEFKGDCLEILEYRYDWADFCFTWDAIQQFILSAMPNMLRLCLQDSEQTSRDYNRGEDFFGWWLGEPKVYSAGVVTDATVHESFEELQRNKFTVLCEKLDLRPGDELLDIGCGWGSFVEFASRHYGARVTGITLSPNLAATGQELLRSSGIPESQSQIWEADYREISRNKKYDKISCIEMAEHISLRRLPAFYAQVYDLLSDDGDGVFLLQYGGGRKRWQFEDLLRELFMGKHIFPGFARTLTLGKYIDLLEDTGFEVKAVDTIGVHYAATGWRWYEHWKANREKAIAKYGARWYRMFLIFIAWSIIASRQGTTTEYQLTLVKSSNKTDRAAGVKSQFGLRAAAARGSGIKWP